MSSYVSVSVIALGCYIFLFIAFMAAKKTRVIYAFLNVLVTFIFWIIGSLCMRQQVAPGIEFWYQLSLLGLFMIPFSFFAFVKRFVGIEEKKTTYFWFLVNAFVFLINSATGIFLEAPEMIEVSKGKVAFVYDIKWTIAILVIIIGLNIAHIIWIIVKSCKGDIALTRQFQPIIWGLVILVIGHVCVLIPALKGFPFDILSGILNAFCMFYALYRRRMFKLTLLVSRSAIYTVSLVVTVVLFSNIIPVISRLLQGKLGGLSNHTMLVIALLFTMFTLLFSTVIRRFIDIIFTKEENMQTEALKEFSVRVTKTLEADEIMDELVGIIHKTIEVQRVYICVPDRKHNCLVVAHSTSPLDGKMVALGLESPAIKWLIQNNKCILLKEFQSSVYYKSMWESEKQEFRRLGIECISPLIEDGEFVGIILLSQKEKGKPYSFDDLNILDSINSVGTIAFKNSRLYEKAYLEARTDELTGLLNRKYYHEILEKECERCRHNSIALILLNVDDFKLYNQLYGMAEGDQALIHVARIIRRCVGEKGYVARYGGKEFAIVLPKFDILSAKTLAVDIARQIKEMHRRDKDYALKILTVSGGVCAIPYSASSMKELMENTDMAVYNVKRKGKNNILVFEAGVVDSTERLVADADKKKVYSEYAATIYALTAAIDTKDHYTFNHSKCVAYYAEKLAKGAGMNGDFVEIVREAGLLHDIGKIGIPEHVLNKPGRLTDEEYEMMQSHVEHSVGIIRNLPSLDYVIPAVIGHHERYDGRGYPRGIKGEDIPLAARILCIADSFDAMVSKRSYKDAYDINYAVEEVRSQSGLQFDPKLAEIFVGLVLRGEIQLQET